MHVDVICNNVICKFYCNVIKRGSFVVSAVFFEEKKFAECIQSCEKAVEVGREFRADYSIVAKYDQGRSQEGGGETLS